MKRHILFWAVIASGLSGCKPSETAPSAQTELTQRAGAGSDVPSGGGGSVFPNTAASYRADYTARDDDETQAYDLALEVSGGKKFRLEQAHPDLDRAAAGERLIVVFDDAASRTIVYAEGPGAPEAVVVMSAPFGFTESLFYWAGAASSGVAKAGSEKIAGNDCTVWRDVSHAGNYACLTRDGIVLMEGTADAEQAGLVATKVTRGAIDASRFAIPAGFEMIDMTPCEAAEAAVMGGAEPDGIANELSETCVALSERFYAIAGEGE